MQTVAILIFALDPAFFLDSTLFLPDAARAAVRAVDLRAPIIDCVEDDFLYVATDDYLYKIDRKQAAMIDRTPLPLRFNYLALHRADVVLVSSNEIVVLDRDNLSFRSGIGIERGDHQPVVKDQSRIGNPGARHLYLQSDEGSKTVLRVIDIAQGTVVRRAAIERARQTIYDGVTKTLAVLDTKNDISVFDLTLKRRKRIDLGIQARTFYPHRDGFSVVSDEGAFLVSRNGAMIDCQPMPLPLAQAGNISLTRSAIVSLDTVAFRPSTWIENRYGICKLLSTGGSGREIVADAEGRLYLIDLDEHSVTPLEKQRWRPEQAAAPPVSPDSLWYVQLGAFTEKANAIHMHEEMRRNGVPVLLDSTDLYRVRFGGFSDKITALDLVERMHLEGWLVHGRKMPGPRFESFIVDSERYTIVDGVVRKE